MLEPRHFLKDDNDLNKSLAKTDLNVAAIIDDGQIDAEMFVPKLFISKCVVRR